MVGTAIFAAFLRAYLGTRLLEKVTLRFVQILVAVMMVLIGTGLSTGLL